MFWRKGKESHQHTCVLFILLLFVTTTLLQISGLSVKEKHESNRKWKNENNSTSTNCTCFRPPNSTFFLQEWRYSQRMILLGPCSFFMGSNSSVAIRGDGEMPIRSVKIHSQFWIDVHEVTKEQFSKFMSGNKNYKTTAEEFGTSFIFSRNRENTKSSLQINPGAWWWIEKRGVTWKTDFKPETSKHPVTHVSWFDAQAFCLWHGLQLPTEIQWEFACRGGLENCLYPWGNQLKPNGIHMVNIWQGRFPIENTIEDGFEETAPVKSFESNAYGLFDMAGNVWEWVEDSWDKTSNSPIKVQKGGSFMCHRKHCFRYRCAARTKGTWDSTSSNLGFRCVYNTS